jgi:hypothetical protein
MFRKTLLTLAAIATLGAAAFAPTAASAGWHGNHGHWHGRVGIYVPTTYVDTSDCYTVRRVVDTWNGPRVRRITVCN